MGNRDVVRHAAGALASSESVQVAAGDTMGAFDFGTDRRRATGRHEAIAMAAFRARLPAAANGAGLLTAKSLGAIYTLRGIFATGYAHG
ncbi:MAG: hypothetical protein ACXVDF_16900 [Ktedonobacterales bacterium]